MHVHLVHWDPVDARARVAALTALGHAVTWLDGVTGTPLMRALRASGADLFLLDLSRRPSHSREVAMALRRSPATRATPIVAAGGDAEAVARLRALLPDVPCAAWGRMRTVLPKALRTAPAAPIVPREHLLSGRPLAQKLGLAAGDRMAVVAAPPGFGTQLEPLPDGARLRATADRSATRFLWFVRSRRELDAAVARLAALVTTQVAWLAWPKAASGTPTDVNGNHVREAGLAAGLVDFKVCSIDPTWSGLAFTRRRSR